MISLTCHLCNRTHLMGPRSIHSLYRIESGPVAWAICPEGHGQFISFENGPRTTTLDPQPAIDVNPEGGIHAEGWVTVQITDAGLVNSP